MAEAATVDPLRAPLDLRAVAAAADPVAADPVAADLPREVTANITYLGRSASVRVIAPTGPQRIQIDVTTARLGMGTPWAQLSPMTQARFHHLAVYAVCVLPDSRPRWLDVAVEEDDDLLFSVAGHAEAHAARYFRRDAAEGGEGPAEPRVVVAFEDG